MRPARRRARIRSAAACGSAFYERLQEPIFWRRCKDQSAYRYEAGRDLVRIRAELADVTGDRRSGEQGSCAGLNARRPAGSSTHSRRAGAV